MKFKDFMKIKYGKNQNEVLSTNGSIPIYGTGGIFGYATKHLYEKPSVLIGRKGTINSPIYVKQPFWTIDTLFYTVIDDKIVLPQWFYYKLSTLDLMQFNEGTTIPSLTTKTLNEIDIDVPNLSNQQHIVDTIGSVDDLMEKYTLLIKKIEEYLRLTFMNLPKSGDSKFYDIFLTQNGGSFKSDEYVEYSNNLLVTIKNIKESGFDLSQKTYLSNMVAQKMNKFKLNTGDVLMTMTGDIGRIGIVTSQNCYLNQRVLKISGPSNVFTYSYLVSKYIDIVNLGHGSVQINVGITELSSLDVPYDISTIEYFNRFSYLFDEIITLSRKIQDLKVYKSSLLHKYFS